ncbi:unnamed protein product [Phytophthora fragariaefolia]|uniref:Unnamed protein product n=1 Tax=Phytophthora fragariaefolia TaxID=1490495 RepID=A0A9W7D7W6_9STRA|nr:unnamed protein product [Phytophthora fragariaefolia]
MPGKLRSGLFGKPDWSGPRSARHFGQRSARRSARRSALGRHCAEYSGLLGRCGGRLAILEPAGSSVEVVPGPVSAGRVVGTQVTTDVWDAWHRVDVTAIVVAVVLPHDATLASDLESSGRGAQHYCNCGCGHLGTKHARGGLMGIVWCPTNWEVSDRPRRHIRSGTPRTILIAVFGESHCSEDKGGTVLQRCRLVTAVGHLTLHVPKHAEDILEPVSASTDNSYPYYWLRPSRTPASFSPFW